MNSEGVFASTASTGLEYKSMATTRVICAILKTQALVCLGLVTKNNNFMSTFSSDGPKPSDPRLLIYIFQFAVKNYVFKNAPNKNNIAECKHFCHSAEIRLLQMSYFPDMAKEWVELSLKNQEIKYRPESMFSEDIPTYNTKRMSILRVWQTSPEIFLPFIKEIMSVYHVEYHSIYILMCFAPSIKYAYKIAEAYYGLAPNNRLIEESIMKFEEFNLDETSSNLKAIMQKFENTIVFDEPEIEYIKKTMLKDYYYIVSMSKWIDPIIYLNARVIVNSYKNNPKFTKILVTDLDI